VCRRAAASRETRCPACTSILRRRTNSGSRRYDGEVTFLEALRQGCVEEMERDERVFILGEDRRVYGGASRSPKVQQALSASRA